MTTGRSFLRKLHHIKDSILPDTRPLRLLRSEALRFIHDLETRMISGPKALAEILTAMPEMIAVEPTSQCNANCVFCNYQFGLRPQGVMTDEVFTKILRESLDLGIKNLAFTSLGGEPFLDPGILKKIRFARDAGFKRIRVITNASVLDDFGIGSVLESGLTSIVISCPALDENEYRRIFRNDLYPKVLKNIHELLKTNARRTPSLEIYLGFRSDSSYRAILGTLDFKKYVKPFLGGSQGLGFLRFLGNHHGSGNNWPGLMLPIKKPRCKMVPCALTTLPIMLYNGDLQACCSLGAPGHETLQLGNIMDRSLKELLFGERFRALAESFVGGELLPVCKTCTMYRPFKPRSKNKGVS